MSVSVGRNWSFRRLPSFGVEVRWTLALVDELEQKSMDSDERALMDAAVLAAQGIPFNVLFVWKDGALVEVKVVAQKR